MNNEQFERPVNSFAQEETRESIGAFTAGTFGWMFLGLTVTFAVAWYGYASGLILQLLSAYPLLYLVLGIAELAVVVVLSAAIRKLSVGAARFFFLFYAVLNGTVFSAYFMLYQMTSLIYVFGLTALFFGTMAVIGQVTHADLSRLRGLLFGGLIFLVVFWLLASFGPLAGFLSQFETAACAVGIFIFLVLTAYDTQKIKASYAYYSADAVMLRKASVLSALQLYLDFINLFLYLLRVLGRRRN
jgi:FtsH-binding integral membrane protein